MGVIETIPVIGQATTAVKTGGKIIKHIKGGDKTPDKPRMPLRYKVAAIGGSVLAAAGGLATWNTDPAQSVKRPGIGQLQYVKFTKPSLLLGEFGGVLKDIDVKRNEHTAYTPSALDRTYTCTLSPQIVSKVSVDLDAITKQGGIKKEADGKYHITVQATADNKTSDVHLISYVLNPTNMGASCNKNQMAKTVDGITGVADMLPLVNLNNAASHISPLVGYGQLAGIKEFNEECSKPAFNILISRNLGNVLIHNLEGDARAELAHEYHIPESDTNITDNDFVVDFPQNFTSLPDQYGPVLEKMNKSMNGNNKSLGADISNLPACQIKLENS